jgi:hypothetical protein
VDQHEQENSQTDEEQQSQSKEEKQDNEVSDAEYNAWLWDQMYWDGGNYVI